MARSARRSLRATVSRTMQLGRLFNSVMSICSRLLLLPGKYYVDNQCIDCDLCRETAPDNFKRNDDGGYSYVYKQPESPEEEARCKEAKEGCPVEAIGDNGT